MLFEIRGENERNSIVANLFWFIAFIWLSFSSLCAIFIIFYFLGLMAL